MYLNASENGDDQISRDHEDWKIQTVMVHDDVVVIADFWPFQDSRNH